MTKAVDIKKAKAGDFFVLKKMSVAGPYLPASFVLLEDYKLLPRNRNFMGAKYLPVYCVTEMRKQRLHYDVVLSHYILRIKFEPLPPMPEDATISHGLPGTTCDSA